MRTRFFILLLLFSCSSIDKNSNYFDTIAQNDPSLSDPKPGQWRYIHNEPHQTFDDYKKQNPLKALQGRNKIYLFVLGNFSEAQMKVLQLTREYIEIFFQLKTDFLNPVSDETFPDSAKRINRNTNAVQLYTPYIFEHLLRGKMPVDGYALMAISEKDLYPNPTWNFVFGMASYKDRIGVSSMYRYSSYYLGKLDFTLLLKRIIATSSHEIGHMFSITHCINASCTMNGSNSLAESDRQPLRLCSECQRKLHWAVNYNNEKRLMQLIEFCKRNNLNTDLIDFENDKHSLH